MDRFVIKGGHPLRGELTPSGNKNAAVALLAVTLLTDQEIILRNLPRIRDVEVMLAILSHLGADIRELDDHALSIHAREIKLTVVPPNLAGEVRASILFLGPLLARTGKVALPPPGGDIIGRRRVDTHLLALEALGAKVEVGSDYLLHTARLVGKEIFLDEASVTGTENALTAAVLAKGTTIIRNAASEPHVQELAHFLNKMGAHISGIGSNTLSIEGVDRLQGGEYEIGPDHVEVGSLLAAAAATGGEITIHHAGVENLRMILLAFRRLGISAEVRGEDVLLARQDKLRIEFDVHGVIPKIDDGPWPAFPADLMSIAIVVATQAEGIVLFFEKMYESRLYFVDKLISMGARLVLADPHRVVVMGPSPLHGDTMESPDIRAGMALVIAALCAQGQSTIKNIGQIDRGYERIEERLRKLGANIERVRE